jgi:hypothetical protein
MGSPDPITRSSFGPPLYDERPIENPRTDIGTDAMGLCFWQTAGTSKVAIKATVVASWNGSSFVYTKREETWNPDDAIAHPSLIRSSTGDYYIQYPTSAPDEKGVSRPIVLTAADIKVQAVQATFANRIESRSYLDPANPNRVIIKIWTAGGSAVDAPFWMEAT